ncbi:alpha-2-macroglobulin family protein, partial [Flaviaesturariibacter amylovorans]|uniref:alpha-2-macroglobulin family protein n=1 Tax=Flaviaesturariibacter amylovorans TaxID=1084520 RepID=UPI0031E74185
MRVILILALGLLFFSTTPVSAQQPFDLPALWARVDSLYNKRNLPRSALKELERIDAAARNSRDTIQLLRAFHFKGRLHYQVAPDSLPIFIRELESELPRFRGTSAALLRSLIANRYEAFYQRAYRQMRGRTNVQGAEADKDITVWTANQLRDTVRALYAASLEPAGLLRRTPSGTYAPLAAPGTDSILRPALFDLLAQDVLDHYRLDLFPATTGNAFRSEAFLFAPADSFMRHALVASDTLDSKYRALRLYQQQLAFHSRDRRPDAYIDIDLERLMYVRAINSLPDEDARYEAALRDLIRRNGTGRAMHRVLYQLALFLHERSERYHVLADKDNRWERTKALEVLRLLTADTAVRSTYLMQGIELQARLEARHLQFAIEKINLPGHPFRILLTYANTPRVYFRLLRVPPETFTGAFLIDPKPSLLDSPTVRTWSQDLPAYEDALQHRVELKVDALPQGRYLLLAATDTTKGWNGSQAHEYFHVSRIAFLLRKRDLYVVDRETGSPLSGAELDVFAGDKKYFRERRLLERLRTDGKGFVSIRSEKAKRGEQFVFHIRHNGDELFLGDPEDAEAVPHKKEDKEDEEEDEEDAIVHFYFDRGIYRPGQVVYFKGIVFRPGKPTRLLRRFSTQVFLNDANYKELDSMRVTTNEYGTFQGRFTLPLTGSLGTFSLDTDDEEVENEEFEVEEYKRPTFEVVFDTLRGSYRIGDTVTIRGTARAFAGNPLPGALVRYSVKRSAQYRWSYSNSNHGSQMLSGEAQTDDAGRFAVTFAALPEKGDDRARNPFYVYSLTADITDAGGESRSGKQQVHAGYTSVILQTQLPTSLPADSLRALPVAVMNLNGILQPAVAQATITRLLPEQRLLRKRYWEQPDQFVLSRDSFLHYFPHDLYAGEQLRQDWPRGATLLNAHRDSVSDGLLQLPAQHWPEGAYEIVLTTQAPTGEEVRTVRYIELTRNDRGAVPQLLSLREEQQHKNGKLRVRLYSDSALVVFLTRDGSGGDPENVQQVQLEPGVARIITVTPSARAPYWLHWTAVRHNRIHYQQHYIVPAKSNEYLNVSMATFRERSRPGSAEQWKLLVRGPGGEAIAAEVLAALYDASLDDMAHYAWEPPKDWRRGRPYARHIPWSGNGFHHLNGRSESPSHHQTFTPAPPTYGLIFRQSAYGDYFMRVPDPNLSEVVVTGYGFGERRSLSQSVVLRGLTGKVSGLNVTTIGTHIEAPQPPPPLPPQPATPRRNFAETAFFFPQLRTNKKGEVLLEFTYPESLTRWKLQALAHTRNFGFGMTTQYAVTQKELMVQPNAPRFLRQGDRITLRAKVVSLSGNILSGQACLELLDAATGKAVDSSFRNRLACQPFTTGAGGNAVLSFPIEVPDDFQSTLTWRITARSNNFSDGEEHLLPVLSRRILVTETLPLPMTGAGTRTFRFEKLLASESSSTLKHRSFTVEYTANPVWYAVQALPYLMEYPYECAEQTWNRLYANALGADILGRSPQIRAELGRWQRADLPATRPDGEQSPQLHSALLEETPWVLEARSDKDRKEQLARLFDASRLSGSQDQGWDKLQALQLPDGSFPWFGKGPGDPYITAYIVSGMGHLRKIGVPLEGNNIRKKALAYLDQRAYQRYRDLQQQPNPQLYPADLQYLYCRSFFRDTSIKPATDTALRYFLGLAERQWQRLPLSSQGMAALALHRFDGPEPARGILRSLAERATGNAEEGLSWAGNAPGRSWSWWDAPVETQALLIEAFHEAGNDTAFIDGLRLWLLRQKQTRDWRTTRATAEACYALLLRGSAWVNAEPRVQLLAGALRMHSEEKGLGKMERHVPGEEVVPALGAITVSVQAPSRAGSAPPSWGAAYWQYFEDVDKITPAATPLQLERRLFREVMTPNGPELQPTGAGAALRVGDKLRVRLVLRVDRDMDYVHLKDLRASALEPVNVLSSYKWQDGLGYYESTR